MSPCAPPSTTSGSAEEEIAAAEMDAGLGNGGLGRLAACFLDSCATLWPLVIGYGLRYAYGMFCQRIERGHQIEEPGPLAAQQQPLGSGATQNTPSASTSSAAPKTSSKAKGYTDRRWLDTHDVLAVPYDFPIPGYQNDTINMRWVRHSAATDEFDLGLQRRQLPEPLAHKNQAENITMVLYPNDATENGKELRLRQQYFLATASIKDVIREWLRVNWRDFSQFAERNCFQLNDTHPTIAVAELMRLLLDEHDLDWDEAWYIITRTMSYTNHTLLPEALERWPVRMFRQLLPRLLDVIYEINARFLAEVASRWPGDIDRQARMSLIEEGYEQQVRMAYLAIVGSVSVNGVAALHSELLQEGLFRDFYELWPEKFNNKTNGVTQRRWMASCNPGLRALITEAIGDDWVTDLTQLRKLAPQADDAKFQPRWDGIKHDNKEPWRPRDRADRSVVFNTADIHVRRAGQAHARVQAPVAERAARHPPVRPPQARRYGQSRPRRAAC